MERPSDENQCPIYKDFQAWYTTNVLPKLRDYYRHVAGCPLCKETLLKGKDAFALGMLTMSAQEFQQALDEIGHEDGDSESEDG